MVAGRLHRQDLHLLEHQLASLQPPRPPDLGALTVVDALAAALESQV